MLTHMARIGVLHNWQLAYCYGYEFYQEHGFVPNVDAVPAAVAEKWKTKRMSRSVAGEAMKMLRQTLPQA